MIDHLRSAQNNEEPLVAFVYCNYGRRDEQTAESLLGTLLRQLAEQCTSIPEFVKTLYHSYNTISQNTTRTRPSIEEIFKALLIVVGSQDRVILVVDALDECSDETCKTLLTKIRELQKNTEASFMATCRPIDALEREFAGDLRLEIRATTGDVENYLDNQLGKLSECVREDLTLQRAIKRCIAEAVDGM